MSVIVKDMNMPKNCCDCDFEAHSRGAHYCQLEMRAIESLERPNWCPLVEAEPRKSGKWKVVPEIESWNIVYCSECGDGMWNANGDALPNYCHNCGAKMNGKE